MKMKKINNLDQIKAYTKYIDSQANSSYHPGRMPRIQVGKVRSDESDYVLMGTQGYTVSIGKRDLANIYWPTFFDHMQ
jgi:hypothetical protein